METSLAGYTSVVRKYTGSGTPPDMDYKATRKAALALRAVNHDTRQNIIKLLQENKRMQVTEIYTTLGLLQAVVSQHLAILRKAKIVTVEYTNRDCRVIYYTINHTRVAEIASFLNDLAH